MFEALVKPFLQETGIPIAQARPLFERYFSSLEGEVVAIAQMVTEQKWTEAGMRTHGLKGSSANLRLNALASLAASLETACRTHQSEQAKDLLAQLSAQSIALKAQFQSG